MRRTIENGFELTGPIARGDWATIEAHRRGDPRARGPISSRSTTCSREATASMRIARRRAAELPTARELVGLVPTMGALPRGPPLALPDRARRERSSSSPASSSTRPSSRKARTSTATRATRRATPRSPRRPAWTCSSRPRRTRSTRPASRPGSRSSGSGPSSKESTGPATSAGVATVCLKLFNLVRPQRAYFGQKDAQQVGGHAADGARPRRSGRDPRRSRPCATPTASRSRRATPISRREERERALALPRALRARDRAPCSTGSRSTTSRRPTSSPASSPPPCASAAPDSSTMSSWKENSS